MKITENSIFSSDMHSPTLTLRAAVPDDITTILALVRELAEYAREPHAVTATEEMLHAALFGDEKPIAYAVIAELDAEPVGFALYFFNFSTWLGKPGLYLEDLYVRPSARRNGVGKALLIHLMKIANARGCGRMEWAVLDWNEPAIAFYKSLGAEPQDESTVYRLTEGALARY